MGGCVVGPISQPEEMNGLRTINPLRPAAPSQRVTRLRGRYSQPHPAFTAGLPPSRTIHISRGLGAGTEGGATRGGEQGLVGCLTVLTLCRTQESASPFWSLPLTDPWAPSLPAALEDGGHRMPVILVFCPSQPRGLGTHTLPKSDGGIVGSKRGC